MNENDIIKKLMVSKAIMDKHNVMPRNTSSNGATYNIPEVADYQAPQANFNIPQEFLGEEAFAQRKHIDTTPEKDAVLKSKLPDDIKKLMLENPIQKPSQPTTMLSDELVEAASRLMKTNAKGEVIENKKQTQSQTQLPSNLNIKQLVKEAVKEILEESGLLVESESKSNDVFSFRVGQHIFEGKVTKIKKVK